MAVRGGKPHEQRNRPRAGGIRFFLLLLITNHQPDTEESHQKYSRNGLAWAGAREWGRRRVVASNEGCFAGDTYYVPSRPTRPGAGPSIPEYGGFCRSATTTGWPTAILCGPQHLHLRKRRHGVPRRHPRFWEGRGRACRHKPRSRYRGCRWMGCRQVSGTRPPQRGKKLHQPCIMHESTVPRWWA